MTIEATFFPTENTKQYGYGSFKVMGISINYTVFPSSLSDSNIFVALPSRKKIVNGQEVLKDGKVEYVNEVWASRETREVIDEAVLAAMASRGVQPRKISNSHSFDSAPSTPAVVPKAVTQVAQQAPTIEDDDDLPF